MREHLNTIVLISFPVLGGNVSGGNYHWLELSGWEEIGQEFSVVGVVLLGVVLVGVAKEGLSVLGVVFRSL